MPVEGPLPQTGDAQDIGAYAMKCFNARTPDDWKPKDLGGTDDYGLDIQVQTTPGQRATDIFRVQLKGMTKPELSADGSFISVTLKASTVRYYDRIVEPILLVVCDLSVDPDPVDCRLHYAWIRDELRRIDVSTLDPKQSHVNLRVPIANRLTRATDLSADLDRHNELARAGQALDMTIEEAHPGMRVEERVDVVRRITSGVSERSVAFLDALAAPVDQHWIEPAAGTLAWRLKTADRLLKTSLLDRADGEFAKAGEMLEGATPLELGEYWFLKAKSSTAKGNDEDASACFRSACEAHRIPKHVAGYVEAELRRRYREEGPPIEPHPDLLAELDGDDPDILSARSRVLAAEGKLPEALAVADQIDGAERHSSKALAYTMFGKPNEALAECDLGLATKGLADNTRQLFLVLRARAKFAVCQPKPFVDGGELIPPSGSSGIDGALVRQAWDAIEDALVPLRDAGWSSNVDLVADIWAATASILGKQKLVLPEMITIAKLRPSYAGVQAALESIAAQCGDFATALEASDRQPPSDMRDLRRALSLHEAGRHRDCVTWFETIFASANRGNPLFGPAATAAAISAHKLARPELVKKWSADLEADSRLAEHAALLQYLIALEMNRIDNGAALAALLARYEELDRPFFLSMALLQELDPTDERQARLCVQISARARETAEPSSAVAIHVGLAMATLRAWNDLLGWCEAVKTRVDARPRMLAFEALALDKLGRTPEARAILEQMLEGGVLDSVALNTYVAIMVRCGYVDEAVLAAEKIMEAATSSRQRMECTRLLFNLVRQSDPGSERLLALALQMGGLADRDAEVEEGIYLIMFLTATLNERVEVEPADGDEFRARSAAFFAKFPNSKIIKQAQFREDASASEMLAVIKSIAGITDDREAFQRKMENQMQRGQTVVPFAWRPRLILTSVHDVAHLWEIAKRSGPDDKKYHMTMIADVEWVPRIAAALRERVPLLDMTALLVVFDLGLLDAVVAFFGKIAIAKSTLEALAALVNSFGGSPAWQKCSALQDALKGHLDSIIQPSIAELPARRADGEGVGGDASEEEGDDRVLGFEHREILNLCRNGGYRLYSDDLALRILTSQGDAPDGIFTLDVLAGLQEVGAIDLRTLAEKVSFLCEWHVGIVVRLDVILALLPDGLSKASSASEGMSMLDKQPRLKAVIDGLWDFRAPFDKTLRHAAAVMRAMVDDANWSSEAVAALLGQWLVKASMKQDAPAGSLGALIQVVILAASRPGLSETSAARLWRAYLLLVEFRHGDSMDERKEAEAIRMLGAECAKVYKQNADAARALHAALRKGLAQGTSADGNFTRGYSDALQKLGGAPG